MLDTVNIGCRDDVLHGVSIEALADRGWVTDIRKSPEKGIVKKAFLNLGVASLTFTENWPWLCIEASLPKLVRGDNAVILDEAGCQEGLSRLLDLARQSVGVDLPALDGWQVSRFDPVWAWDHDPALYLGALTASHYPRSMTVCYGSSVRWQSPKGNMVRARCYDKAEEARHSVDLPLRFERQVRSATRETVRVGGKVIGRTVDEALSPAVSRAVLSDALHAVGLDRPIRSILSARRALLAEHGDKAGARAWSYLVTLITCGGVWPEDIQGWQRREYRRMWDQAGVSAVSPEGELPALQVP